MNVKVKMKDGTLYQFQQRGGDSYVTVEYKGAFVVVTDEWGNTKAFPAADVESVDTEPGRRGF